MSMACFSKKLAADTTHNTVKSLYDALEKNESLGLGLSEKRTSIEVTATRQHMRATCMKTRWVNSDRQLADVLTKPTAPSASIHRLQQTGRWKLYGTPTSHQQRTYETKNETNTSKANRSKANPHNRIT